MGLSRFWIRIWIWIPLPTGRTSEQVPVFFLRDLLYDTLPPFPHTGKRNEPPYTF